MLFLLAWQWGKPVAWVRRNVGAAELDLWAVWMQDNPFGPKRDDYRAAMLLGAFGGGEAVREAFPNLRDRRAEKRAADAAFRQYLLGMCPALGGSAN